MVAIVTNSTTLETRTTVHRRQADDLPAHVKGTAFFKNYRGQGGQKRYKTRYYITTSDGTKRPVEFIHANGQDSWYSLEKNDLGQYITTAAKKIPELVTDRYLRYWNVTDPQHPDYVDQPEEAPETFEPAEEQPPIEAEEEAGSEGSDHSTPNTSL